MTAAGNTEIQDFYQDTAVLVTGGTGTLGKLTIEKILRSCPGVRTVYVLVRPKKGLSVEERKKAILDNVVFDRMKSEQPQSVQKIVFVPGDCSAPRLGLSHSDYHDLTQHVNIVLHLAATVRFDEKLQVSVNVNTKGTIEVIDLCKNCLSLKAAVFVSTAYSNCIFDVIEEEFYDPPLPGEDLMFLLEKLSASELKILTPKILGAWPNTYVFSKAMAENAILTQSKGIPASIVRPSMVGSTLAEPVPGWIDNLYGPIALLVGYACGILRVAYCDTEVKPDSVPADITTNCIIAAALPSSKRNINDAIKIYNVADSGNSGLTAKDYQVTMMKVYVEKPLKKCIWYPFVINVNSYMTYMVLTFFLHFIPGCLLDLALRLKNKPVMLLKIYRTILHHSLIMNYFLSRSITILTENTENLYTELSLHDQEIFPFNTKLVEWPKYLECGVVNFRKYVLNGFLDSTDEEGYHLRKLYIVHTVVKYLLYGLTLWTAWRFLKFYVLGVFS